MRGICKGTITLKPNKLLFLVGLLAVLMSTSGCTHKPVQRAGTAIVAGSLKLNGQPVRGGNITFISQSDPDNTATCRIRADGNFAVADAPIGEAKAIVDTESTKGFLGDRYVKVPEKYWKFESTELTLAIKEGENMVALEMK